MHLRSPVVIIGVAAAGLVFGVFVIPALLPYSPPEDDRPPIPLHHHRPTGARPRIIAYQKPVRKYPTKAAPAFTLPDQNGVSHSLAEAKGKWVVLAFYPMDDSGGCTMENKSFSAQKDQFGPLNAVVYAVSTQDVASKKAFAEHASLNHTLLADVGGTVAQAYGVYMGGFAGRVTFYIRPDGTIAAVDDVIHLATAAEDSIAMLKSLQAARDAKSAKAAPAKSSS